MRWSDDDLNNWIEEATIDISAKTLCYEVIDTSINTEEDTLEYSEPSDCIKVHSCVLGGTPYEWTEHLDDDDWESLHPDVDDWGVWHDTYWTARITAETTFALVPIGTWADSYAPTKLKVSFTTEGTAPDLILYDSKATELVNEEDYITGTAVNITMGENDIGQIRFALSNMNEDVTVTDIQFYSLSETSYDYIGLIRVHPRLVDHLGHDTPGKPICYYHHHNKIGFWPVPDVAYPMNVYCSKMTDDITNLPCNARYLAILHVLAKARLSEGWEDDYKMIMAMYQNQLMHYRKDIVDHRHKRIEGMEEYRLQ